jgi:hypothetical protein
MSHPSTELSALVSEEDNMAYELERESIGFEREMLVRLTPGLSAISVMEPARRPNPPGSENTAPFIFLSVSVWTAIIVAVVLTILGVRALLYGPR